MTAQEFKNRYDKFITDWLNKKIEAEDPSNLFQCMDAIFKYCDYLGIPRETVRHLYAYEVFTKPNDATRKYFDIVANVTNDPNVKPPEGAIVVFGKTVGFAGHVSIGKKETTGKDIVSNDQNWNGLQYLRPVTHYNYYGVLGWLIPKTDTITGSIEKSVLKGIVDGPGSDGDKLSAIRKLL